MAKKQCRKNLRRLVYKNKNNLIVYGYKYGVWQSTIIHTFILLLLSLIVIKDNPVKPIKLSLSFDDSQLSSEIVDTIAISLPDEVVDQNTQNDFETIPKIDSNDTISDINLELIKKEYTDTDPAMSQLMQIVISDTNATSDIVGASNNNTDYNVGELIPGIFSNNPNNQHQYTGSFLGNQGRNNDSESADIDNRLRRAGAKTGDIQISIGWDTIDDIDLHVMFNNRFGESYICWMSRIGVNNGMLDIDMNANPAYLTNKPVENIFWPNNQSPEGNYVVGIHNFRNWSGNKNTQVTIIIKTKNFMKTIKATAVFGQPTKEVFRFSNP